MAINEHFSQSAQSDDSPLQELNRFEKSLRELFREKLANVLESQVADNTNPIDIVQARHLSVLKDLAAALAPGAHKAAIFFDHEKALPVSVDYLFHSFQESLVRLRGETGTPISPKDIFDALADEHFDTDLATSFRLWLTFASIADYHHVQRTTRLSVNIVPHDLDSNEFRDKLDQGLTIFSKCGFSPLILEATEYDPWKRARRLFLKEMAEKHEVLVAIDDYGAEDGFNYKDSLKRFARDIPGPLIVKLDGKLVTDFIENRNENLVERLHEIQKICPDAVVVAEWMPTIEDIPALRRRLTEYGVGDMIGLVQSVYLQNETPSSIIRKLDRLEALEPPQPEI
ncbi:MAG TPA: EAL domain-containing protein [Patescibacteria group bacterium]|nr:EAL domain-containing protein [Patescibacteria group bacterium]